MQNVDYIIRADHLLTMEGDLSVIKDGAVAVTGSEITDAGTFSDISKKYTSQKLLKGRVRGGRDRFPVHGLCNISGRLFR
jgi:hypothetical protein